jgi:hypothetical protein
MNSIVADKREIPMKNETHAAGGLNNTLLMAAIIIGLVAIVMSGYAIFNSSTIIVYRNVTTTTATTTTITTARGFNINSAILIPPMSLANAPVITENQTFGERLTNINAPFNSMELAIINNAPDSYFEKGGEMLLNQTLTNRVGGIIPKKLPDFILNGKPIAAYFGSTTCIYCAENKWAMAMALSRFGSFSQLFKGYSALQDGDLPSVFWAPAEYNDTSTTSFGAFFSSNYISFLAIEDSAKITGGFTLTPLQTIQTRANATQNLAYDDLMKYIILSNDFRGTPFTIWGSYEVAGVDAVILGNSTPTSNSDIPLSRMTQEDVLRLLGTPNSQFAWSEYAAADIYVAMLCKTLNDAAPVCNLPAIQSIGTQMGI